MKMLVVAHDSNFSGGANRSLYMVLTKLKNEYGVEIEVLLPKKTGQLNEKLTQAGIPWFSHTYFGVVSGIRNDGKDILRYGKVYIGYLIEKTLAYRLKKKLADRGYDLVYTNTRLPFVGAQIARLLHIPHVCHVREFGTTKPLWGFWDYNAMYEMSDRIICISQALKDKFTEYVPEDKLVVIHNGIDSPLGLPCDFDRQKETFDMILTGRLVPDKGHEDAIKAMKRLSDKGYHNIKLHIVGSSPSRTHIEWYAQKIRQLVSQLGLDGNVIFHGEIHDMISIRKEMDVELMCAICETFGRVTVEGMRSGLTLIGSNTGGTLEIIQDGKTGLLYEQGNEKDLADKIELLYDNADYRKELAKNGYDYAQDHFTPDSNVSSIYTVLSEVVSGEQKW